MPIKPENRQRYPVHWPVISRYVREHIAGGRCEFCGVVNGWAHPVTGSRVVLTVAHLDQRPENNIVGNLRALCQRCHLAYDADWRARARDRAAAERQRIMENAR